MKKIFFITFSLSVTAFTYQSCMPVDNTKAWAKADSLANSRLVLVRDSLKMACMNDVMTAAQARADSMMQSHGNKGSKPKPPAPPPPPTNPKDSKMQGGSNTDDKKGKMSGAADSTATQKKKDKMKGAQPPK